MSVKNQLLAFGSNGQGQLGIGTNLDVNVPTECLFFSNQTKELSLNNESPPVVINGGGNHSAFITHDGELWVSGSNGDGQCGPLYSNVITTTTQEQLSSSTIYRKVIAKDSTNKIEIKWKYVACGWTFTVAITQEHGLVYTFGKGLHGELGCGNSIISSNNKILQIENLQGIKKVDCGLRHCVGLTYDGICFGWGNNKYGQLGPSQKDSEHYHAKELEQKKLNIKKIEDIACGQHHTLILTCMGQVYSFGLNKYGQLGYASPLNIQNSMIPKQITNIPSKVIKISCGWNTSMALCEDNKVLIWGRNDHGQLGKKMKTDIFINLCICGSEHSLAISTSNECFSWGWNEHGNCGTGNNNDQWTPVKINTLNKSIIVKKIATGCGSSWIWINNLN
ncbi:regulator of chromosome condensation 1/beta-lactamase-inhibitor protein II [Gigaspora rosea]|uniref:Regulator of chromosome condensation 1/beta-lactamase-inhibitor protein II n=1 Tax=Gigaspora rosea TaxID=44941 RepID=A0A397V3M3_9GLOM|nr:regulator of chromosome condensation 1/beta-lactamase-inhibitor protein II [Gigaspora rosea]